MDESNISQPATNTITGSRDTDKQVLAWVDDTNFRVFNESNHYLANICADQDFCRLRLSYRLNYGFLPHGVDYRKIVKDIKSKSIDWVLVYAVKEKNLPLVSAALQNGADVNYAHGLPLSTAAQHGFTGLVTYLLDNGTDIHHNDDHALRAAAILGHFGVVELLIDRGADISARDYQVVHSAIMLSYLPVVKYVMTRAPIGWVDIENAICLAIGYYLNAVIEYFVTEWAHVINLASMLEMAARHRNLPVVVTLVEHQVDVNANDSAALVSAAMVGSCPIVEYLLDHGANIHARGDQALEMAILYMHFEVYELLMDRGADPLPHIERAARLCAHQGSLASINQLVDRGAKFSHKLINELVVCGATFGSLQIVEYAVARGADITTCGDAAAAGGFLNIIIYLIERGAKFSDRLINKLVVDGARAGSLQIVEYAVASGADITAYGEGAIVGAAAGGFLNIIIYLIEHGADLSASVNHAVGRAVQNGHLDVLEFFVSKHPEFAISFPQVYRSAHRMLSFGM